MIQKMKNWIRSKAGAMLENAADRVTTVFESDNLNNKENGKRKIN